ncbi:hypothetical protein [Kitasatospora mediocidica]|uniref:hypothetical protein n=1 Tax=Kitasatospora mediocidica TaxID=58352 RepID=UPI00056542D3|nr:hypothetical protein [Kitasatospora mediocidica]
MSERRDRRRLHARARALGVPIEQAVRRPTARPARAERLPARPQWPRTELPDRDVDDALPDRDVDDVDVPVRQALPPSPARCCAVTRTREITDGGTVVLLTRHAVDCPVWSAR